MNFFEQLHSQNKKPERKKETIKKLLKKQNINNLKVVLQKK